MSESRSVKRRKALQKGDPMPTFENKIELPIKESNPDYNEPIEGEVCGMSMEAYAITVQALYDEDCISKREVRQIASYVELDRNSPQFMLELPKLIHQACERWLEKVKGRELDEDEQLMDELVRTLEKTTALEIRKAVS